MPTLFHRNVHCDTDLSQHYRTILARFQSYSRSFVRFHLFFLALAILEIVAFFCYLPALTGSLFGLLIPSLLFLTLFAYLGRLFYDQAKRPDQLHAMLEQFLSSCRTSLDVVQGELPSHLSLSDTLFKLSQYLHDYEYQFIRVPDAFAVLSRLASHFSARCYQKDVFQFKQLLLHTAIDEHLQQMRLTPTDLEVHASLAASYIALSKMYLDRSRLSRRDAALFEERFKKAAALAIEEFQILSYYAPNDPWVHEQLALGYRDLNMYQEEIMEVEILSRLKPQDRDVLFRLGSLYFQQGLNAKGLAIYEELKRAHFKRADDLISSYGCMAECQQFSRKIFH